MLHYIFYYLLHSLYGFVRFLGFSKAWLEFVDFAFGSLLDTNSPISGNSSLIAPGHLAVSLVLEDDLISFVSLFDLIAHASVAGVNRITFYDPWSRLKAQRVQFVGALREYILQSKTTNIHISVGDSDCETPVAATGDTTSRVIHLHFLGKEDGKPALSDICKKLSSLDRDIEPSDIESELSKRGILEPDLLLIIGTSQSLAGYPPFSLRVSEFTYLPALPLRLSYDDFDTTVLRAYSCRDRRLGR